MAGRSLSTWFWSLLILASAASGSPLRAETPSGETVLLGSSSESGDRVLLVGGEGKDVVIEARPSDAERIARLQRSLEGEGKHLLELQHELANPDSEYHQADAEFKELDGQLDEKKKALADPQHPVEEAARLKTELEDLQKKWELAKQRFDLAIQERKALQSTITALEQKITKDREAVERVLKPAEPAKIAPDPRASATTEPTTLAATAKSDEQADGAAPTVRDLASPLLPSLPAGLPGLAPKAMDLDKPKSIELKAATVEVEQKQAAAKEAQAAAQSLTARREILERNIDLERTLLQTAFKMVENSEKTLASLEEEFNKKLLAGTDPAELLKLRREISTADTRVRAARAETRSRTHELDELHTELAMLQAEQIGALQEADARSAAARSAQRRLVNLQNPFSLKNVLSWLLDHGPRMATILIIMAGFLWLSRSIEARFVDLLAQRNSRDTPEERENRAWTLVSVVHNAAGVIVFSGGTLMLLGEVGVPIGPLMGGAAVIGLSVAFGAQSLIKDYFSGFMILLEQQYLVNDVIKIDDISGQVERITLRMTVLRDLEGRVHFVPHGSVGRVTNLTHGWSRAVFDIGVAYHEDVDRVMNVLVDLGRQLREDPQYYNVILEDPEMLGVDSLGDSAVMIKFSIKTRPLKQWMVRRELLRRIKNRFDQLGIEIPYPTHTIVQRGSGNQAVVPGNASPQLSDPGDWADAA